MGKHYIRPCRPADRVPVDQFKKIARLVGPLRSRPRLVNLLPMSTAVKLGLWSIIAVRSLVCTLTVRNLHTKRLNVRRSNLTGSYYLATPTTLLCVIEYFAKSLEVTQVIQKATLV